MSVFSEAVSEMLDEHIAVFGETVTYDGAAVDGIFDRRHVAVDAGGDVPVTAELTTLVVKTGAVPTETGATVVRGGLAYRVVDVQPDEQATVLVLEKQ